MALPIAIGSTATDFADGEFTVVAGSPASLFITASGDGGIPSGVEFELALKTAADDYNVLITLDASNILEKGTVNPPATYAVRRLASSSSAGMEVKQ